jgi:hypothetical protein
MKCNPLAHNHSTEHTIIPLSLDPGEPKGTLMGYHKCMFQLAMRGTCSLRHLWGSSRK